MSLTKSDLQNIGEIVDTKLDAKFDEKLAPIKKDLTSIKRKLTKTIKIFDRDFNYHHRRLVQLEEKVGIKPPEFLQKIN